jgi:hypothetical protein
LTLRELINASTAARRNLNRRELSRMYEIAGGRWRIIRWSVFGEIDNIEHTCAGVSD